YAQVEDLLNIGAYASGSNPDFDLAIACKTPIDQFLQQGRNEVQGAADFDRTSKQLLALVQNIENARRQLDRRRPGAQPLPAGPGMSNSPVSAGGRR
ncbi:MAG: hypothetical protein IT442_01100, partial [Phycisphaeraceae bacterium]|nr:hypothetical protein [Phycisphaeraceae bacterium]